jgi:CRISPR/Cas system-associated exonuclease Cas4 (RecB family)
VRGWLHRLAEDGGRWMPVHVELGLGFPPGDGRDPASRAEPVTLEDGWRLHGIVDLVERRADGRLRVTDHKTGRNPHRDGLVIGGGAVLQPVLYGLAVEAALGAPVHESRLSFCTSAGGHTECVVTLEGVRGAAHRRAGLEALEIVDRALEAGFLPAAPAKDACARCDFLLVCGPHEERRAGKKMAAVRDPRLGDLAGLREAR